jgi:hypothetical protein
VSCRARRQRSLGVVEQLAVDHIGQSSFQTPHGFFVALARRAFASIVAAAFGVVADLTQRHHVQGMVELTIPSAGKPVPFHVAGGHLNRRGAGIGSERRCGTEPAHAADPGQDLACEPGPNAVELGECGAGVLDRGGDVGVGGRDSPVETTDLGHQVGCKTSQRAPRDVAWPNCAQQLSCDLGRQLGGCARGDEFGEQRMPAVDRLRALLDQVVAVFGTVSRRSRSRKLPRRDLLDWEK